MKTFRKNVCFYSFQFIGLGMKKQVLSIKATSNRKYKKGESAKKAKKNCFDFTVSNCTKLAAISLLLRIRVSSVDENK